MNNIKTKELYENSTEQRDFLLSIKPEYAFKILSGEKSIELRRSFPAINGHPALILIYASSPIKAIVGCALLKKVEKLPVMRLWNKYGKKACIHIDKFEDYFEGKDEGFALFLDRPITFSKALKSEELDDFYPPQSYKYLNDELYELLKHEISQYTN